MRAVEKTSLTDRFSDQQANGIEIRACIKPQSLKAEYKNSRSEMHHRLRVALDVETQRWYAARAGSAGYKLISLMVSSTNRLGHNPFGQLTQWERTWFAFKKLRVQISHCPPTVAMWVQTPPRSPVGFLVPYLKKLRVSYESTDYY